MTSGLVRQTGRIVALGSEFPVESAEVTALADDGETEIASAITAADGSYALDVAPERPFTMRIAAPEHVTTFEQETWLGQDHDRKKTLLLPRITGQFIIDLLGARDPKKGICAVNVLPTDACPDVTGATLEIVPGDGSKVVYVRGRLPSKEPWVDGTAETSAIVYDLPPNRFAVVRVAHPSCAAWRFPVKTGELRYTGRVFVPIGDEVAFVRVYLGSRRFHPDPTL